MKIKPLALVLNLAMLLALLLSACGPTAATPTEAPSAPGPATEAPANADQIAGGRPVEITVAGMPQESNPTGLETWKQAVAASRVRQAVGGPHD